MKREIEKINQNLINNVIIKTELKTVETVKECDDE